MTPKQARGQLRQIAQEMLPEVMAGELFKELQKDIARRLDALTDEVRAKLKEIDDRQRTVQNMIVRDMTRNMSVETPAQAQETAPNGQ